MAAHTIINTTITTNAFIAISHMKESKLYNFVRWLEVAHPEYTRDVYSNGRGLTMSQARYVEKLLDGKYPGGLWTRIGDRKLLADYAKQYQDELTTED